MLLSSRNKAHFTNSAQYVNLLKNKIFLSYLKTGWKYIVILSENKSNWNCLFWFADQEAPWHAKTEDLWKFHVSNLFELDTVEAYMLIRWIPPLGGYHLQRLSLIWVGLRRQTFNY